MVHCQPRYYQVSSATSEWPINNIAIKHMISTTTLQQTLMTAIPFIYWIIHVMTFAQIKHLFTNVDRFENHYPLCNSEIIPVIHKAQLWILTLFHFRLINDVNWHLWLNVANFLSCYSGRRWYSWKHWFTRTWRRTCMNLILCT